MSLLALTLSASTALATPRTVPGLVPGEPRVDLAAVEHQQTFIQTEREGVNVRVEQPWWTEAEAPTSPPRPAST